MDGQETAYKDPDFICGYEVIKRAGEARPLYTYLIRNPKNPEERAIAKCFDVHGLANFGLSKLEVMYFVSDVLDFLDLGLVGALRIKEGIHAETNNICFDYVDDKTVYEIVKDNGTFEAQDAIDICRKVALVLSEAEREGFFHLALNPKNIYVSKEGGVTIKDWVLYEQNVALFVIPQRLEFDPYYFQAPELLDMKGVSARADIYSLGLLAAFMTTGDWKIKEAIAGGVGMPAEMRRAIRDFIAEDPDERIEDWKQATDLLAKGIKVAAPAAIPSEESEIDRAEAEAAPAGESALKEEGLEEGPVAAHEPLQQEAPAPVASVPAAQRDSVFARARQRRLSKKTVAVVLSIFVVLCVLGVILAVRPFFRDSSTYTARSEASLLPSLVGMNYEEAVIRAEELGVICEKSEEHNQDCGAGIVISQEPGEDEEITEGMVVRLTVSLGPEASAAPLSESGTSTGDSSTSGDTTTGDKTVTPAPQPTPGSKPVVSASASPSSGPSSGVMVTLSASAYDPDGGSIVSYSWSCGGSGPTISREFASATAPQTVTVSVTVTDDEGQTATSSVSINLY